MPATHRAPIEPPATGHRSRTLVELLTRVTERVCEALAAEACSVLASDGVPGEVRPLAHSGVATTTIELLAAIDPWQAFELVDVETPDDDGSRAVFACPIPTSDGLSRMLIVTSPAGRRLTATERGFVDVAARLAGTVIEQYRSGAYPRLSWHLVDLALDLADEAVVVRDASGRIAHINAPARAVLGIGLDEPIEQLDEARLIRSLDLRDQWGQRLRPGLLPHHRVRTGMPSSDLVVSGRSPADGSRRWMLLHAYGIPDATARPALVLTVLRDFAVIQRHDASQRLRERISPHLHAHPANIPAIERELGIFIDGTCAISLVDEPYPAQTRSRLTLLRERAARRQVDSASECEAGAELRLVCGHLHLDDSDTLSTDGMDLTETLHVATLPIEGDGVRLGRLTCRREPDQPCFDAEEIALLREIASQIGLTLAVDRLRESLDAGERMLVDMTQQIHAAEEAERRRMALSIHDGLAQVAASVCQQLEILAHRFAPSCDDESAELQRAQALAHRTVREARMLIAGLRPVTLDEQGLGAAILEEIDSIRAAGWDVRMVDGVAGGRFDPDVELELFRVVQESLNNVRKHAGITRVDILLEQRASALHLEIRDRGAGFTPGAVATTSSQHVGLSGMQERIDRLGGSITIESESGKGTRVIATVPI